jgi:hypothetical protein
LGIAARNRGQREEIVKELEGNTSPGRWRTLSLLGALAPRGAIIAAAVSAAIVLCAVTVLVLDPFGLFGPGGEDLNGKQVPMSLNEYARKFPKEIGRLVYPYSVIPGGISTAEDARRAVLSDPVVREHYRGLNLDKLTPVTLGEDKSAYVSYRKGDKIFWTTRKIHLFKGETVLTDGNTMVRARCGNLISDAPMAMASLQEPPEDVLNSPVLPTGPLALLQTPDGLGPLAAPSADENGDSDSPLPATPNTVIADASGNSGPNGPGGTQGGSPGGTPGTGGTPSFSPPGTTPFVGSGAPPATTTTPPSSTPDPGVPSGPGSTAPPTPSGSTVTPPVPSTPTTTTPPSTTTTPSGPGSESPSGPTSGTTPSPSPTTPASPPSTPSSPGSPPGTPQSTPTPSSPTGSSPEPLPPSVSPPSSIPGGGPPVPPFDEPPSPGGPGAPAPTPTGGPTSPTPPGPTTPSAPPSTPAPAPVPEPASWLLAACGLVTMGWLVSRMRWQKARAALPRPRLVRLPRR